MGPPNVEGFPNPVSSVKNITIFGASFAKRLGSCRQWCSDFSSVIPALLAVLAFGNGRFCCADTFVNANTNAMIDTDVIFNFILLTFIL